jgi:predicted permease
MIGVIFSVVVPILITVSIGFAWTRLGYQLNSKELTALISDIATPCLIINTFQETRLSSDAFLGIAVATATAIILFTGVGALLLWLLGLRIRTFPLPSPSQTPVIWACRFHSMPLVPRDWAMR